MHRGQHVAVIYLTMFLVLSQCHESRSPLRPKDGFFQLGQEFPLSGFVPTCNDLDHTPTHFSSPLFPSSSSLPSANSISSAPLCSGFIGSRYQVDDPPFAVGGDGILYRAKTIGSGPTTVVAIKVIEGDSLCAEAVILRELDHPNIVRLVEYTRDVDRQYLVLELIEGLTLARLFRAGVRMSPSQVLAIMQQILRAVIHYQAKGIVHHDLHVDNVMIEAMSGRIKVIDFGDADRSSKFSKDRCWLITLLSVLAVKDENLEMLQRLLTDGMTEAIPCWLPDHELFKSAANGESLAMLVNTARTDPFPFRLKGLMLRREQRYHPGRLENRPSLEFDIELVSQTRGIQEFREVVLRLSKPPCVGALSIPGTEYDLVIVKPTKIVTRHANHWLIFSHASQALKAIEDKEGTTSVISPIVLLRGAILAVSRLHAWGISLVGSSYQVSSLSPTLNTLVPRMEDLMVIMELGLHSRWSASPFRTCLGVRLNSHSVRLAGDATDIVAIRQDYQLLLEWAYKLGEQENPNNTGWGSVSKVVETLQATLAWKGKTVVLDNLLAILMN